MSPSGIQPWQEISDELIANLYIFNAHRVRRISPRTGKVHPFVVLKSPEWVNVLPVTPEGKVLFVHQFRQGTGTITMEVPAGMVDPDDPDPAETARRELLEETGYSAETVICTGIVESNPAFMNNRCHTFLALNVRKVQEPQLDGGEDIVLEEVPLDQLDSLVTSGRVAHSLTLCAFYNLQRFRHLLPG
jgi:8-oxo-dGTP pyrophosphatase MutT (NUDIX family)